MIAIEHDEELRRLGCEQLLQIHDEIICRCPTENAPAVRDRMVHLMVNAYPLESQLQAKGHYGQTWAVKG